VAEDVPDCLTLKRHRDLVGRRTLLPRRIGIGLLGLFLVAALANVFGQRPDTSSAAGAAASFKVYAPSRVRSGLYFEARFTIDAHRELKKAQLVLDPGWLEGMTINTIEPSPLGEGSSDGKLVLELGHIPAGNTYLLFMQLQVNPTNVGHRSQGVVLMDGSKRIASIGRQITIYP
jgi:hypothetical protein